MRKKARKRIDPHNLPEIEIVEFPIPEEFQPKEWVYIPDDIVCNLRGWQHLRNSLGIFEIDPPRGYFFDDLKGLYLPYRPLALFSDSLQRAVMPNAISTVALWESTAQTSSLFTFNEDENVSLFPDLWAGPFSVGVDEAGNEGNTELAFRSDAVRFGNNDVSTTSPRFAFNETNVIPEGIDDYVTFDRACVDEVEESRSEVSEEFAEMFFSIIRESVDEVLREASLMNHDEGDKILHEHKNVERRKRNIDDLEKLFADIDEVLSDEDAE